MPVLLNTATGAKAPGGVAGTLPAFRASSCPQVLVPAVPEMFDRPLAARHNHNPLTASHHHRWHVNYDGLYAR